MSTLGADSTGTGVQSQADGGIITEVRLDHPDLFLRPTLQRIPTVTVEPEYWTTVDSDRTLLFVSVYGSTFEEFETALEADPTVSEPVLIDRYPGRNVYRVAITDRAVTFIATTAKLEGRILELEATRDGWIVQLQLPNRELLVEFNDACRRKDITFQVNHLRRSDDGEDGVVGLTPKQQHLLTVAYEEGYFEVPRGISQNELARQLGVSKSAISQRLRRAIAELCASSFTR